MQRVKHNITRLLHNLRPFLLTFSIKFKETTSVSLKLSRFSPRLRGKHAWSSHGEKQKEILFYLLSNKTNRISPTIAVYFSEL